MAVHGWDRADFESDDDFNHWTSTRPPAAVYYTLADHIVEVGLPAVLRVVREDHFTRIELIPMVGWTWLAPLHVVNTELGKGWVPHISLTKWTLDMEAYKRIYDRYHDQQTVIEIARVSSGAAAVLAWSGIGADQDIWDVYIDGDLGYKWSQNSFGPRISL